MTFIELCERFGIPYKTSGHHHCRPGWVQLDCWDCSPNYHHYRLGYNVQYGYFNCWACGRKNTYDTFTKLIPDGEVRVKEVLADLVKGGIPEVKPAAHGQYLPPNGLVKLMPQHRKYLEKRGLDPDELEKTWDIRAIGLMPQYQWRVFIPIYHKLKPVSWTTRSLAEVRSKYLTAEPHQESVDSHSILYGEDYCTNAVVITEGPFDVWKIGPGAVATLGLGYSTAQLARMAKYSVRAVCFDSDHAGRRRARQLVDLLSCLPGTTYHITLDSKDAGSATDKEIRKIREKVLL